MPEPEPVADVAPEAAPATDVAPGPAPAAVPATDLESLCALWPAVVELVGAENKLLSAVLRDTRPVAVGGEDLTVAFASSAAFLKKKAEHPDNRAAVADALRQITGGRWRLSYELSEASADTESELQPPSEEEWVKRFIEEFDAEELPPEPPPAAAGVPVPAGRGAQDGEQPVNSEQEA